MLIRSPLICWTKEYEDSHITFFGPDSVPGSACILQAKNHEQCGGNGVNSTPELKKTEVFKKLGGSVMRSLRKEMVKEV